MTRKTLVQILLPLFVLGFVVSSAASAAEMLRVVPVVASVVDETVVVGIASGSEGVARNIDLLPKDLSSYVPMPIPFPEKKSIASQVNPAVMNQAVLYSAKTGKEMVLDPTTVSGPVASFLQTFASSGRQGLGASGGDAETQFQNSLETFTDIVPVGNT